MPITRQDFTGLTDWYLDSSKYQLEPAFYSYLFDDVKELDNRRLEAYRYFIRFYKDRHWEETGEVNPAYGARDMIAEEFNRRTWNHAKNIVDKLVSFLVKEPWTIKLPEELMEGVDASGNNKTQKLLDAVWEANDREDFSYKMAYMGCITGDCFIKMSYDEDFYADGVGELAFEVLDSRTVIPFFDDKDRTKMIGCRIQYPITEIVEDGSTKQVMYKELHTESTIVTMLDDEIETVVANPLGEMLVVHIKNEPLPMERFGRSDVESLIMPSKEFNEKISDLSEILAYHAAPVTIIKGARVQSLEKGARKVWGGIPKDGDVFNLSLDADLSSSMDYIKLLRTFIGETGSVPEEVLSNLQEISNASGSSLQLQYQPVLDRTEKKQVCYGKGLRQLNRLILRFYEAVGAIDLPEDISPAHKYKTSIEWGNALPRDRSIDLADISTEMGLGIESKHGALKRLGEENPDAKLEEIAEEMIDQAQMDFMTMGIQGFGDPSAGPDTSMGTKSGAEDGPQNDVKGAVASAKTNPVTQGNQTSVQAVKKSAQTTTNTFAGKGKNKGP